MKYMATYDWMESFRNTSEWTGATARAMASYPIFAMSMNPMINLAAAWGEVAERSFGRMAAKPDWGIRSMVGPTGQDHLIDIEVVVKKDFGNLIHFAVRRMEPLARKVLVVAPMSGHYATLLRSTITSLLPDADVYVTDWHNARDIPVSAGKFDIEDYTLYLVEFMRHLGPDTHVIAVCQPAPLTLAATAYLAAEDPAAQPRSLTLIGGPIDPDAAATDVTDFGSRVTMGQLEQLAIQRVGFKYKGAGRLVYPGLMQLAGFISMNGERHSKAFQEQIMRVVRGEASDHDAHNRFYDEYLAVMDMTAEFYLSTVERIFKNREIAKNEFIVAGKKVDIGAIKRVAVMTVEGEKDDISAPGQCVAALAMLTGLPDAMKTQHLEPEAGHYGIFAGKSWRLNIRPLVLGFIDAHSAAVKVAPVKAAVVKAMPAAEKTVVAKPVTVAKATVAEKRAEVAKPVAAKPAAVAKSAAKPAAKPVIAQTPAVVAAPVEAPKSVVIAKQAEAVRPPAAPVNVAPAPVASVAAAQPPAPVTPVATVAPPATAPLVMAPQPQTEKLPDAARTAPATPTSLPALTPVLAQKPAATAAAVEEKPASFAAPSEVKSADTKPADTTTADVKPVLNNVVTPMRRSTQS
jgi:poly(3-hydroxybutyrate) depolymerase